MSSRHTRRKAAKARAQEKLIALATAQRSANIAKIVRENKSAPIERNYYPQSSFSDLASRAAFCRGANGKRLLALPKDQVKRGK